MKPASTRRLPEGRPATLARGLPWRFTHMKVRLAPFRLSGGTTQRLASVQLGWDEGPELERIIWLSAVRRLMEVGACTSYVEALALIPCEAWTVEELAVLDLPCSERELRRQRRPPRLPWTSWVA